jgi:hypothetical protein
LENISVDGRKMLEWILGKVWNRFICLRIGTSGGFL